MWLYFINVYMYTDHCLEGVADTEILPVLLLHDMKIFLRKASLPSVFNKRFIKVVVTLVCVIFSVIIRRSVTKCCLLS